jgi:molybdenum cofactor cytidylyltransferase
VTEASETLSKPITDTDIGVVILGAGFSRRFGSDKRLHPLNGLTVAECTVMKYLQVFTRVRVVLRPQDVRLTEILNQFSVEKVVANDAHLGMGHSLAAGFTGLEWTWAFVALLDMPFVSVTTLRRLKQQALKQSEPAILRPRLSTQDSPAGETGHPIGWHNSYFEELGTTSGDVGAKSTLIEHELEVIDITVTDEGIVHDIDRPEDLRDL